MNFNNLLELVTEIVDLFEGIDGTELKKISDKNIIFHSIEHYILYLCMADERISRNEKVLIESMLNAELTYDDIITYIENNDISLWHDELEEYLNIYDDFSTGSTSSNIEIIYHTYLLIGQIVVSCDGKVDDEEANVLLECLSKIESTIKKRSCQVLSNVNPHQDVEELRKIDISKTYSSAAVEQVMSAAKKKADDEAAELDRILNASTYTPWGKNYLKYSCPYCGQKRVRYTKWDDIYVATAFLGVWGLDSYICDNCGKKWD